MWSDTWHGVNSSVHTTQILSRYNNYSDLCLRGAWSAAGSESLSHLGSLEQVQEFGVDVSAKCLTAKRLENLIFNLHARKRSEKGGRKSCLFHCLLALPSNIVEGKLPALCYAMFKFIWNNWFFFVNVGIINTCCWSELILIYHSSSFLMPNKYTYYCGSAVIKNTALLIKPNDLSTFQHITQRTRHSHLSQSFQVKVSQL